jgi:predicted GNAT family N-acyltransferase
VRLGLDPPPPKLELHPARAANARRAAMRARTRVIMEPTSPRATLPFKGSSAAQAGLTGFRPGLTEWGKRMELRIVRETVGGAGWRDMVALRHRVLRAPLGLAFSAEQLSDEAGQIHLALWLDDRLAGTLLLLPPDRDNEAKLRQMAIRPGLERRGLGTKLVQQGERELAGLGAASIRLSARESAVGFYARLGYVVQGSPFIEVTLPHRLMRRRLGPEPRPNA